MKLLASCQCGRQIQAKASLAGQKVRCPSCGTVLRLPTSNRSLQKKAAPKKELGPLANLLDEIGLRKRSVKTQLPRVPSQSTHRRRALRAVRVPSRQGKTADDQAHHTGCLGGAGRNLRQFSAFVCHPDPNRLGSMHGRQRWQPPMLPLRAWCDRPSPRPASFLCCA